MKVVPFDGDLDAPAAAPVQASAVVPFDGALDPGPDTTASDDAMRAGDPMGIVAQEQYKAPAVTGSVFDNQDQGGPRMDAPTNDAAVNERALDNARKSNPDIDKSPMYSTGAAREKANALVAKGKVAQDKAEAERTKSSGSTAQDVALNILGGFGGTVNKAGATISQAVGAEDAEAAFDSAAEMYKKMQADNGGGMLPGKVAGFVGSVAPAIAVGAVLPAAEAYVLLSNAGLFALPAFRDTLKEKLAAGQDFPLALAHASQSFGLNLFLPNIASRGGALLNSAAGKGIIGNAASAAAEGAGFSAATTVLDKGTDLVAGEKNQKDWLDFEDMGTMALGFGAMRGIHGAAGAAARGVSAGLDRVGSPSQQFGRALGQDVDAAGFDRAQPANLNPNLRDVAPKAADPVAEIFKTGSVEEAAAAAARAADVPLDGQDTAAALRSARPMRPKPVEPTEGALDERAPTDVRDVPAGADGAGPADARGGERAPEAGDALVEPAPGLADAVAPRAEPFATKPEANMAALKEDAVAVPAEGGWTLQLKTLSYSDKEVAANEADIAAINDGLNHNNEARAEAGLPGDREPVRLLTTAPTPQMVVGRRIARLLGVKVVFVEDHPGFSGVALRGVAYVSPQAKHPELAIIGHEVTHGILQRLRAEDPARAQALHEQIAAYVRPEAVDKKQAAEPDRSRQHAEEEVIADLNGSMWLDPKFWAEMRKNDPSTFRKVAYAFMQAIAHVGKNLSRFKADSYATDVEAVRKILAREMSMLAREEGVESHSPTEKQELGIKDAAKPEPKPAEPKAMEPKPAARAETAEPAKPAADESAARGQEPMFARKAPDTPEFRKWFDGSRVVDAKGEPQVVYHGSIRTDTDSFDTSRGGAYFTNKPALATAYSYGRALSTSRDGGAVYPVYLALKNPLVIDALGKRNDNIPVPWQQWKPKVFGNLPADAVSVRAAYDYAIKNGHDGLIVRNVIDTPHGDGRDKSTVYVASSPEQIKSATGNNGKFDAKNPDIRFDRKEAEKPRKPGEVTREEARQMGDLRKKVKVLESLLDCLAG